MSVGGTAIDLRDVTLARDHRIVLSNVTLAIRRGEFIGVFGPNGSGKTTFLQAVLGLVPPLKGVINVDGQSPSQGRVAAGYLPQQRTSMGDLRMCARDFVAAALDGERWGFPVYSARRRRKVDDAIAEVHASALGRRRVDELSGGELQRLFLAQALLGSPPLLLLDEPLQGLDPHYQMATIALVKEIQLRRNATVLFTAHDVNPLVGAMDRVLYFGNRRAVLGAVDEVINSAVLSSIYDTPIEVLKHGDHIIVVTERGVIEAGVEQHNV